MTEALAAWTPRALSMLRIITGLLIIQHGMGKIIGFPVLPAYANVQPLSLIGAAGFIELIGGALLILGLCTRPVAFILAGEMAFAYFIGALPERLSSADQRRHAGDPVLLHLPVSVDRGRRPVEHRRQQRTGLEGATMDKFNKMLARCEPMVLSIFRIITGLLLFQYGVAKLFKFPALPYFANVAAADHGRGRTRTGARRAADARPVDAAGRVHPVR